MKKQGKILVIIFLAFLLFSCKSKDDKNLIIGTWAIDNAYSVNDRVDVFFRVNMITFKKRKACALPRFDKSQSMQGVWRIDKINPKSLFIESDNNPLDGAFEYDIYSQGAFLKLDLVSETYKLHCSKLLRRVDREENPSR